VSHVDPSKSSSTSPPSLIAREPHEYTLDEVLPHLKGVRKSGKGYAVRCPVHGDRNASASIRQGDTRNIVFKCHAGCTFEEFINVLNKPLFRKDTEPDAPEPVLTLVSTYVYKSADGSVFAKKKRFVDEQGKKTFRWTALPEGQPPPLYRLDEIQGKPAVAIAEGEKDVDTLWSLGIPATCSPHGASRDVQKSKWEAHHTQQLIAAGVQRVVVFADNDAAGRAHQHATASACMASAVPVVRVVTFPDLLEGGDVTDWIAAGHTKDELVALLKASPLYVVTNWEPEPIGAAGKAEQRVRDFGGIFSTNLGEVEPEEVQWLWPRRIPLGMLTIIAGTPGLGKSYVTLDIAARITIGAIWPDVGTAAPEGTVVLLAAEDSIKHTVVPRLIALKADRHKIEKVDAVETQDKKGRTTFSLATDIPRLEKMVLTTGAKLVIVDPVNSYLGGKTDGFKDVEVREVLDPLKEMAERLEIAVVLIMHLKKGVEEEIIYRIGGSIGFGALARTIFFCAWDAENAGRVYFTNAKMNIAPKAPTLAYRIHPDMTLEWGREPIKLTAQEILASSAQGKSGPKQSARQDVKQWLVEFLKDGPQPAIEGERLAVEKGYRDRTLRRAMKDLGIVSTGTRNPESGQITGHVWTLPPPPEERPF